MNPGKQEPPANTDGRPFYRITPAEDGLVDIWLTPGKPIPMTDDITGAMDFNFRVLAVRGIDPKDPQWGGSLGEHIRRHYADWIESAEVIEI